MDTVIAGLRKARAAGERAGDDRECNSAVNIADGLAAKYGYIPGRTAKRNYDEGTDRAN